ncbi:MAG: hypothetical protein KF781_04020 [Chitinophagaceae bacterium]|nr:hypothetical protein [Chitinophagaceae bacterium]MCW5904747.1 hypothetical protein [Chitinophagaceae bacterium]
MKKVFTSVAFLLCTFVFALNANAQTDWVTIKLDNRISIKFPKEPAPIDESMMGYKFMHDDGTLLTASLTDLEKMGLDSASLAGMIETEEFLEQFKIGFSSQTPGTEIIQSNVVKWHNYVMYDIIGEDKEKGEKSFYKCLFMGSKMFVFVCILPAKGDINNRNMFFESMELIR